MFKKAYAKKANASKLEITRINQLTNQINHKILKQLGLQWVKILQTTCGCSEHNYQDIKGTNPYVFQFTMVSIFTFRILSTIT